MALDYHKCAQEIADNIGGGANVVSAAHCATRLRLVIADNGKVNKAALEEIDGVKGMFESSGQLQLIIGTGTVNKVFDEFVAITGVAAGTKDDVKAAAAAKAPIWKRALKTIGDVFVPILPAIVASGLMMGLVEALGKIEGLNFAGSDWYSFLDTVANTAFAYLPVIVAISAARVFGGNLFLGAVIGLLMIHAAFLNGWNVANAEQIYKFFNMEIEGGSPYLFTGDWAKVAAPAIPRWNLIGNVVSIQRSGYQGHVIPVIIAVWFMSTIEKWLHKHVPEMIDLFVTPLCTVFATALVTLVVIGPIFSFLETKVLQGAQILVSNPFGSGIMGAIYPWTVVMGLHHMYNVIEAGMLSVEGGLNTWMPIASAANFAQFGACLAVGLKAKNAKTKSVAIPSALSASLGITEPAIFG
ncbi:MAG: PTS transporter subunit EIIC, partial [Lachnospiraceae bacterium]|nr:PTS transporter subunit EIIC [Lachnospiraceae bacterium]